MLGEAHLALGELNFAVTEFSRRQPFGELAGDVVPTHPVLRFEPEISELLFGPEPNRSALKS
jgi:hypothetical protein